QAGFLCKVDIKIQGLVRRNAETRFKKARFYAAFRVSQSPNDTILTERSRQGITNKNILVIRILRCNLIV
uniref:hypothetical protein n=1 Tax=Enterocloster clostridioformis TaxID=1531 RepID=UPI0025A51520